MLERGRTTRWWKECAGCAMERRLASLEPEQVVRHRRWNSDLREMVLCEGGGKPPATVGEAS